MKKFKLGFTVKYVDELELTEEEYQEAKKEIEKEGQLVSCEALQEEIADFLGTSKDNVEVVEYVAEVVDEGEGE